MIIRQVDYCCFNGRSSVLEKRDNYFNLKEGSNLYLMCNMYNKRTFEHLKQYK